MHSKGFCNSLRLMYGLSPNEPNDEQLTNIEKDIIADIKLNKEYPDVNWLGDIVLEYCESYHKHKTAEDLGGWRYRLEIHNKVYEGIERLCKKEGVVV